MFKTKLNEQQKEAYERDSAKGKRAKKAYEGYLKDLILDRQASIFVAFGKTRLEDVDALINLRHLLAAISDIEREVLLDIEKGDYANKLLNEAKDDN